MRNKSRKSTFDREALAQVTFERLRLTALTLFGVALLSFFSFSHSADTEKYSALPSLNPVLARFNEDITFYASFDGYVTADLSVGEGAPRNSGDKTDWNNGIVGQALHDMAEPLEYTAQGNIDLVRPGALTMWISPQNWMHEGNPEYIHFVVVNIGGVTLQVSRMGDAVNTEKLYAWFKAGPKGAANVVGDTLKWQQGWYLLAVNWGAGYVEFSVDGGAFTRIAAPSLPDLKPTTDPGMLYIGAGGVGGAGNTPYLMDELFVFNRPLKNSEVQWIYQLSDSKNIN